MRPATLAAALAVAIASTTAPDADAQSNDRYGGSSSSFDFEKAFEGLSSDKPAGGYRNEPPASPPAPAPNPPASNDLRPQSSQPADPSTSPSASRSLSQPPTQTPANGRPSDPFGGSAPSGPAAQSTDRGSSLSVPPRSFTRPPVRSIDQERPSAPPVETPATPPRSSYDPPADSPSRRDDLSRSAAPTNEPARPPAERSVAVSSEPGPREVATQRMLEKMLRRHRASQLGGTPMSLASVIADAPSRDEQGRRIDAYWALTSAVADYYLGLYEASELQKLRNEVSTYSQPLGEAQSKLATRVDTSLKAARSAQYRLARLMGTDAMPLPADTPFTGPYATRLESVFPAGATAEARLLHDLLPLRLAELQDAAGDLAQSEDWVERVRNDQGGGSSGEGVIRALRLNALSRRAFVQLARDYNLQINRYTQLAAPELVDTGRLVAMLIRTPASGVRAGDGSRIAGSSGDSASANLDFRAGAPSRR